MSVNVEIFRHSKHFLSFQNKSMALPNNISINSKSAGVAALIPTLMEEVNHVIKGIDEFKHTYKKIY